MASPATARPHFEYVSEGDNIPMTVGPLESSTEYPIVVGPSHEGGQGHWYCVIHREHRANNMAMQSHNAEHGVHIWAWICHEHGPEVP